VCVWGGGDCVLTQGVCGPQGAGPRVLVGLRVAGGQRFGHGRRGAVGGVAGPAQRELQGGTLREALEGRQALERRTRKHLVFQNGQNVTARYNQGANTWRPKD